MPKEITNEACDGNRKLLTDSSPALADVHYDGKQAENAHRIHMDKLAESLKEYGILPQLALEDRLRDEKLVLKGGVAEQKVEAFKKDEKPEAASVYEVQKGDSIWGISRAYLRETTRKEPSPQEVKATAISIAKENRLSHPDQIHPGQKLKMPELKAQTKVESPDKKPTGAEKTPPVKPENVKPAKGTATPHEKGKTADSGLDFVRDQFDKIDQDNDHHVTQREIDHYISDNKASLNEKQVSALTKVGERANTLQKQANDEVGFERNGISRLDLDAAEKRMRAIEYAQEHFDPMDGDGNGHVNKKEIRGYMRANDDRLGEQDRANCQLLMEQCGDLDDKCDDEMFFEWGGFSKKDLEAAQSELGAKTLKGEDKLPLPNDDKASKITTHENFAPVTMQAFSKESLRLFDKIDADADGSLTARELRAAAQSDNYKGKDKQVLSALYKSRSDIAEMHDDDFLMPDSTITRGDLEQMEAQRVESNRQTQNIKNARDYLSRDDNFVRLDTDADNFISKEEIYSALQSNSLTKQQRESLSFLRDHVDAVADASNDERGPEYSGISQMDLDAFGNTELAAIEQNLRNAYELQKQAIKSGARDVKSSQPTRKAG